MTFCISRINPSEKLYIKQFIPFNNSPKNVPTNKFLCYTFTINFDYDLTIILRN